MSNKKEITLIGRVIDQKKQAPISGAKVSLNFPNSSYVVYTDLEGIYIFTLNFGDYDFLQGQIKIEANGYSNYNSFIQLSPAHKDIGDIQLVYPDTEMSDISLPIVLAFLISIAVILTALFIPLLQKSPQERPVKIRNSLINISRPFNSASL
jgi:hypothetical protein